MCNKKYLLHFHAYYLSPSFYELLKVITFIQIWFSTFHICPVYMSRRIIYLLLPLVLAINLNSFCQVIDTTSFVINSRFSFYSYEKSGEMILHVPASLSWSNLNIILRINDKELTSWKGIPGGKILRLSFRLELSPAHYIVEAEIKSTGLKIYRATAGLTILNFKPNEVKTDRLTGGLIVNRRILFPFGFLLLFPCISCPS